MPTWSIVFDPRIDPRTRDIVSLIVEIEAFKRSVLKIPLPPHMQRQFDKVNIIRQIKGTTGIEGNTLSEEEIEKVLGETRGGAILEGLSLEGREAKNAETVHHFIVEQVKQSASEVIAEDLIRTIHSLTTDGCNYKDNVPGQYRHHSVVVDEYRGPDHWEIPRLMREFLDVINSRAVVEGYGPLIRAILAHFYLISIHPFGDGNGRTSRGLEAYILYQAGYNVRGFYSLANFYYRHRFRYIEMLQAARFQHNGNLTQFVRFSLEGFLRELHWIQEQILEYVRRVLFRDVYLEAARYGRINGRCASLLEYLTFDALKGIPLEAFKNRTHHIPRGLYDGKTQKTLLRDLRNLTQSELVTVKNGMLMANLDLMNQYS